MAPRHALATLLALALCGACATAPRGPRPVSPEASAALAEVRRLQRRAVAPDDPELALAVARARYEAPDWIAPMRAEDDLRIASRMGVDALARRRAELAADPTDARMHYLVGRLESTAGTFRFEHALSLERDLAWAHHGLAWAAGLAGDLRSACAAEERALRAARDEWERAYFTVSLAGFLMRDEEPAEALGLLRQALAGLRLPRDDRAWLEVETALVELRQRDRVDRLDGFRRAMTLLREEELAPADLARLVSTARVFGFEADPRGYELELALAARSTPERDRLRAELLLTRGSESIATRLLEAAGDPERDPVGRPVRFALGGASAAIEAWTAALPRVVVDASGRPRDPRLARVVASGRALAECPPDPGARLAALDELGDALVAAGWLAEARALSEQLAAYDLAAGLALRERAVAGLYLLDSLVRALLEGLDPERPSSSGEPALYSLAEGADEADPAARPLVPEAGGSGVDHLLDRLGPVVARANEWLGGETDPGRASAELIASPRLSYGPFASVVHPGLAFSDEDEARGRGRAGARVGGLAAVMDALGRFAIVGEYLGGGGPDGVILRRLLVERRAGEHLGVRWSGTVAWCEGSDLDARAGRGGARVSGAALHEGFWIDVESVRRDREQWAALAREYRGPGASERVERVLAERGIPLYSPPGQEKARTRERRQIVPALGEADRVRLAVLRDRAEGADPERPLGEVELEELLECVARHEEGHLVDRELFLPIGAHLGRVLRLVLDEGFSPANVMQRLEYRAQLLALCVAADPRLLLVELLVAAEVTNDGPLPHGRAYRELLGDLVEKLDDAALEEPERWPRVDRDRTLVHQLHLLSPGEVRALALELAARKGIGAL